MLNSAAAFSFKVDKNLPGMAYIKYPGINSARQCNNQSLHKSNPPNSWKSTGQANCLSCFLFTSHIISRSYQAVKVSNPCIWRRRCTFGRPKLMMGWWYKRTNGYRNDIWHNVLLLISSYNLEGRVPFGAIINEMFINVLGKRPEMKSVAVYLLKVILLAIVYHLAARLGLKMASETSGYLYY